MVFLHLYFDIVWLYSSSWYEDYRVWSNQKHGFSLWKKFCCSSLSLPHVTTNSCMTQERTEAQQCQQAKVADSTSTGSTTGMRESENQKNFHTATKHLILHCLNNGHSGEKKSRLCFWGWKKKVTVLEPHNQSPPRLESLTTPVQMGLSGILSLHIHIT